MAERVVDGADAGRVVADGAAEGWAIAIDEQSRLMTMKRVFEPALNLFTGCIMTILRSYGSNLHIIYLLCTE